MRHSTDLRSIFTGTAVFVQDSAHIGLDLLVLRLQLLVLAGDERLLRGDQALQVGQSRALLGYGLLVGRNKLD